MFPPHPTSQGFTIKISPMWTCCLWLMHPSFHYGLINIPRRRQKLHWKPVWVSMNHRNLGPLFMPWLMPSGSAVGLIVVQNLWKNLHTLTHTHMHTDTHIGGRCMVAGLFHSIWAGVTSRKNVVFSKNQARGQSQKSTAAAHAVPCGSDIRLFVPLGAWSTHAWALSVLKKDALL